MRLVEAALRVASAQIARMVQRATRGDSKATRKADQEMLFASIREAYRLADEKIDTILFASVLQSAKAANAAGIADAGARAGLLKFDEKRLRDFWDAVHPDKDSTLAATMTKSISDQTVRGLRDALVSATRQGELAGWTANQRQKQIQALWDKQAGDIAGNRFVDRAGRPWDNARYLQMLVRTTQQKVTREAYMSTLVANGDDLAIIRDQGDNCKVCNAWRGLVISISGQDKRFPSYDDSLAAGMWHPNCDCQLARADEDVHMAKINANAKAENTDWKDLDKLAKYREEAGEGPATPPKDDE